MAQVLQLGRTTAYALVSRFVETDGAEGMPAVRVCGQYRVPRVRLEEIVGGPLSWPPAEREPRGRSQTHESRRSGACEAQAPSAKALGSAGPVGASSHDVVVAAVPAAGAMPPVDPDGMNRLTIEAPACPDHGISTTADQTTCRPESWSQQSLPFEV
ncbi:MAG: hypothetical protein U0Q03_11180 [Acidimicrobiales bacterium]